jgi:hypothetical protein
VVTVLASEVRWQAINQIVFIPSGGYYSVFTSAPLFVGGQTGYLQLRNLGYPGNAIVGATLPTGPITPAGIIGITGPQGVTGPVGPAGTGSGGGGSVLGFTKVFIYGGM